VLLSVQIMTIDSSSGTRSFTAEIRDSLQGKSKRTIDRVSNRYRDLRINTSANSEILNALTDLSRTHGPARAERFLKGLENVREQQPDKFDFEEYYRLFRMAHIRFGAGVADHFVRSLKHLSIEDNPYQEYFDAVDTAVEVGGKKFARYYASSLPWMWGQGGNAQEYRSAAMWVLRNTDFKTTTSFLWCAPQVLEVAKISPTEFSELSVDMHRTFGSDVSYWALRGLAGSHVYGMKPKEFKDDVKDVMDQKGIKAAGWYASAFQGICNLGSFRLEDVARWEKEIAEFDTKPYWGNNTREERLQIKKNFLSYAQNDIDLVRNFPYKQTYIDILNELGQASASLYVHTLNMARRTQSRYGVSPNIRDEVALLDQLPVELIETAKHLKKSDFGKMVWYGFKIPQTIADTVQYLRDSRVIYDVFGPSHLAPQLQRSLSAEKYHRRRESGILYPMHRPDTVVSYGWLEVGEESDEIGRQQLLQQDQVM
jgi:hypothetical protein